MKDLLGPVTRVKKEEEEEEGAVSRPQLTGGAHAQTLKNSLTLAAVEGIPTSMNGPVPNP